MGKQITKKDAISAFGDVAALAAALGITRAAIYQWPEGPIPELRQLKLIQQRPDLFRLDAEVHPPARRSTAAEGATAEAAQTFPVREVA